MAADKNEYGHGHARSRAVVHLSDDCRGLLGDEVGVATYGVAFAFGDGGVANGFGVEPGFPRVADDGVVKDCEAGTCAFEARTEAKLPEGGSIDRRRSQAASYCQSHSDRTEGGA